MAKVLFCLPRYHTNAVPWMRILRKYGHVPAVFVSHVGPTENHAEVRPLLMRPSRSIGRLQGLNVDPIDRIPSFRQVWREMRVEAPDLVIVRGVSRWLSRICAICAIGQGRRLVVYDQEDPSPKAWSTRCRRAALAIFGIRHFTTRISNLSQRRAVVGEAITLPFGCPVDPASLPALRSPARPARILMVAKYRGRKGHFNLLQALASLGTACSWRLMLCGEEVSQEDSDFCARLRAYSVQQNISERVVFNNNVVHRDMPRLYLEHDVYILPSRDEPAAVSPIEAAWFGCAVLISADSGTRGYIPPSKTSEFDPNDPEDIARALKNLLHSNQSVTEHRTACYQHIQKVAGDDAIMKVFNAFIPDKK